MAAMAASVSQALATGQLTATTSLPQDLAAACIELAAMVQVTDTTAADLKGLQHVALNTVLCSNCQIVSISAFREAREKLCECERPPGVPRIDSRVSAAAGGGHRSVGLHQRRQRYTPTAAGDADGGNAAAGCRRCG